jgi:two-component system, NtrC family, sensor kinase
MNPFLAPIVVAVLAALLTAALLRVRSLRRRIATLESQRDAARAESEAARRLASAGRIAAGLAHEVGNPLCAITNYAHSLGEKVAPELRPAVKSLQVETARIQRIMDGLIEHSRPREAGASGADVNAALRDTLRFLGEQGVLRRITIDERLGDGILPVSGTALELEQTFTNLLLNAADAMPAGGKLALWTGRQSSEMVAGGTLRRAGDGGPPEPARRDERVVHWLTAQPAAEIVKIVVADSGHGVERGREETIFEPYVTTKSPEHGTGLGLAIVRGLVRGMGGIVWAQRSREGGAAFHIVLPPHSAGANASR